MLQKSEKSLQNSITAWFVVVAGSCECSNKPSGSIQREKFFD
jgi:hypothetical protein